MKKLIYQVSIITLGIFLMFLYQGCDKDDPTGPEEDKVVCTAGCSEMSWSIKGESGSITVDYTCNREYNSTGGYIETCTGTRTYSNSGNTYNFTAVYDWPNCSMSVTVTGVGSCSD